MAKQYLYNGRSLKAFTRLTDQEFLSGVDEDDIRGLTPYSAYALVPWARRCVSLRAGAIASMPFTVKMGNVVLEKETMAAMPVLATLPSRLWRTEAAVCTYGAGYLLKQKNDYMTNGLQWALPSTMTPWYSLETGALEYVIRNANNRVDNVQLKDLVYFWEPSISCEVGPGTSLVRTALTASGLTRYADVMVSQYFERGAVGTTILTVEGNPNPDENKRLENWWKKTTAGISKMFGAIAVSQQVKVTQLVPLIRDLMVPELTDSAREQIATTLGVYLTMLGGSAQVSTRVAEDRLAFYTETVIPRAEWYAETLNDQLFHPMGMEFAFDPEQLDIMQKDEVIRSGSLQSLVTAGFPLDMAAEILGYDLDADQWARLKEIANKPKPASVIVAPGLQTKPEDKPTDEKQDEDSQPEQLTQKAQKELATWKRFAVKHGATAAIAFECKEVPEAIAIEIRERLKLAGDADATKAVFDYSASKAGPVLVMDDPDWDYKEAAIKRILKLLKERLNGQYEAVLLQLGDPPNLLALDERFWLTEAGKMAASLKPEIMKIAQDAAQHMVEGGIGVDWTLVAKEAATWARQYVGELITNVTDTTREMVRESVSDFINTPGLTMGDLKESLMNDPAFSATRADMIATTEVTRAYAQGQVLTAQSALAAEMPLEPVWHTNEDELVCPNCGPLNDKTTDEVPPLHPRCILPGNEILIPSELLSAAKSIYIGRAIEITTSGGRVLTVTENHPILTTKGWVAANFLREGDYVFSAPDGQRMLSTINPDNHNAPTVIEQVYDAFVKSGSVLTASMPVAAEDFHGDGRGINGNINVVYANSLLQSHAQPRGNQPVRQDELGSNRAFKRALVTNSPPSFFIDADHSHFGSDMGIGQHRCALCGRSILPADEHALGNITRLDTRLHEAQTETATIDTRLAREFLFRFASHITHEKIIKIRDFNYSGHVYDLQDRVYELYICNGVVVKNCRCWIGYRIVKK